MNPYPRDRRGCVPAHVRRYKPDQRFVLKLEPGVSITVVRYRHVGRQESSNPLLALPGQIVMRLSQLQRLAFERGWKLCREEEV